jgi:hypothetical protein
VTTDFLDLDFSAVVVGAGHVNNICAGTLEPEHAHRVVVEPIKPLLHGCVLVLSNCVESSVIHSFSPSVSQSVSQSDSQSVSQY